MKTEVMRKMLNYHHWANRQVEACIDKLSEDQFKQDHSYSQGSVYNIAFHLISSELYFMAHFEEDAVDEMHALRQEDYPTWGSLRALWAAYRARVDAAMANLTDAQLLHVDVLPGSSVDSNRFPLWEPLFATIDHATDHRAQILALIGMMGGETCEHEYWFYMFER